MASRTCGDRTSRATCRIVLVRVGAPSALPLVRQLLNAQEYWRVKGLRADLVILNEQQADYLDEMQHLLSQLVQESPWAGWFGKSGGMFLLRDRGHGRRRPPPLVSRGAGRAAGRPGRSLIPAGAARPRGSTTSPGTPPEADLRVARGRRPSRCRADAGDGERAGRLHARGTRVRRRAGRGARDAAAVVERAGEPRLRNDRQQRRFGVHVGRQQPREPAHALRQRSADRPDQRGVLPSRRGHRRRVGRDAGAASAAGRRRALGHPPRRRRHALSARHGRPAPGTGGLRGRGRSGEAGAADAHEHVRASGGGSVCSVTSNGASGRRAAASNGSWSPTWITASGAILAQNTYNSRPPGAVAFFRASEPPASYTGDRIEFIGRNRQPGRAGRALSRAARRAYRRRPGPVRGAADRDRSRARRVAPRSRSRSAREATTSTRARSPSVTAG